jgi:hypothetical protein
MAGVSYQYFFRAERFRDPLTKIYFSETPPPLGPTKDTVLVHTIKLWAENCPGTPVRFDKTTARSEPFQHWLERIGKKSKRHAMRQHHYILVGLRMTTTRKKGRTQKCGPYRQNFSS